MSEIHDHTVNRLESLCEIRGEDGKIPAKYQEYHDILAVIKTQDAEIERLKKKAEHCDLAFDMARCTGFSDKEKKEYGDDFTGGVLFTMDAVKQGYDRALKTLAEK